jgi:2-polyprenyl-3-methyl-5-hydroxy-6-metoxy-1,4-benzoquinol methylase
VSQFLQPLPREGPVNRERYLLDAARGKSVIHVGFADHPLLDERIAAGTWLHAQLAEVAASLVGLDIDAADCAWANARGFEVYAVDASSEEQVAALELNPAEVVIAGEVIEHLDAPGPFLRAMRQLGGRLIVTTPNAYRPLNVLAPLMGKELIHADHMAWHSPATLRRLLERSGWEVLTLCYYQNEGDEFEIGRGLQRAALGLTANIVRGVAGVLPRPYWCDGLIAVACHQ